MMWKYTDIVLQIELSLYTLEIRLQCIKDL